MENPESRIRFEHIDVNNSDEVISFIKRNLNTLQESNVVEKKNAIQTVYDFLEASRHEISSSLIELILNTFLKTILKALSDSLEKIREISLKILNFLLSRCEDISKHLPYIISVLIERMNCEDLEGISNLPEVMRPMPSQKPHMHVKLNEPVEEIRMEYNDLINTIISCSNEDEIRDHINDMVHILRSLIMDPNSEVQIGACKNISMFCKTYRDLLFHFSEIIARAILLPLVSKKSKVRIAALEAMGQVLYCGCFKYNANIMEVLIGFRDPNVVPIRDFFEYSTRINYLAILIKDPKTAVREALIRYLGDWLIILPDRYDHETRLVPYLLSGLFDPDEEIRKSVVEIIEEIGIQYEKEKEKDLREIKQFGFDSEWAQHGKTTTIVYPDPLKTRPRIGARYFIRQQIRKFLNAMYREVKDLDFENRLRSANLLLFSIVYSEEYVTQYLNKFIAQMLLNFRIRDKEDRIIYEKIGQVFHYIGIFCPPDGFIPLIRSGIKGELIDHEFISKYTLHSIYYLLTGCFQVCNKEVGMDHKKKFIYEVIDIIGNDEFLGSLDSDSVTVVENILECILKNMLERAPAEELEHFYTTKKYQLEIIFYTVIGFKLAEFTAGVSKANPEESFIPKLSEFFEKNTEIMGCFEKLDQIYEDLMLDNFIETFIKGVTENYLSLVQWKIIFALITTSIIRRTKSPEFYHDTLKKTLGFLSKSEMTSYSKAYDILNINILITKLLGDSFDNKDLSESHSIIFFYLIDILRKTYNIAETNASKTQELRDKMLTLSKIILCRDINWKDCLKNIASQAKEMYGNVADLLQVILKSLQNSEKNLKDLKARIKPFNRILTHIQSLTTTKPEQMITSQKVYVIPQIIEFLLHLHERFFMIDEEGLLPDLFEGMLTILLAQKEIQDDNYNGHEAVIPNYNEFIERIIVLNLDTKDSINKEKYRSLLKIMARKTPFNLMKLWEKAVNNNFVSRMDLLDSIRSDLLL